LAAAVEHTPVGNRNNMLFWGDVHRAQVRVDDLRPIAEAGLRCGQTVREVQATWRSAAAESTPTTKAAGHERGPCRTERAEPHLALNERSDRNRR
jgi:hypothetical protein